MWEIFRGIFGFPREFYPPPLKSTDNDDVSVKDHVSDFNDSLNVDHLHAATVNIHTHFQREIENMMKSFFGNGFRFDIHAGLHDGHESPSSNSNTLRDSVLKPGFSEERHDSDLDSELDANAFDRLLGPTGVVESHSPKMTFYYESVRTVRHPDGTTETIRTVRDQSGREESTLERSNPMPHRVEQLSDEDLLQKLFK